MSKVLEHNKKYSFINTSRKGVFVTENIEQALEFLHKLKIIPSGLLAVVNDKNEMVRINNIKNLTITVRIEGKLEKIEK